MLNEKPGSKQHKVTVHKLDNGAEGLLIDVPDATVMAAQFNFRAGYYLAPQLKWETPHVMEHMSLGANKFFHRARAFEAEFKKNGAYSNASTGTYHITYESECADFEWDRVLDLMILAITEPLFTEEEFAAEVGNVHDELVGRSNNHFRTIAIASSNKFGLLSLYDTERIKQLRDIQVDDIRHFYKKTHTSENLRFIVAGDLSGRSDIILSKLENMNLTKGKGRIELPNETPKPFNETLYIRKTSVPNIYFDISTFAHGRFDDDLWDAAGLANNILTETLYSKIFGEARERGLVYHLSSGFELIKNYVGWSIGGQVIQQNLLPLLDIAVREIKKVMTGDIEGVDIDAAKQYALGRYQRGAQTVSGVLNGYAGRYYFEDVIDDYYSFPDRIKAVQKETIIDVMRHMFAENIWGLSMLGTAPKPLQHEAREKIASLWQHL